MNRKSLSEDLPENVKYRKKGDVPLVLSLELVVTATPQRTSFICVSCEQCNLDLKPQMHRCCASAPQIVVCRFVLTGARKGSTYEFKKPTGKHLFKINQDVMNNQQLQKKVFPPFRANS